MITGTDGISIGHLYAFERETGYVVWHHQDERGFPTDLVRWGANVYAVSMNDKLTCFDLDSGHVRGTHTSAPIVDSIGWPLSPAVADGRLYYAARDRTLSSLRADSGIVVWQRNFNAQITTDPLIVAGSLYLGAADSNLYRFDPATGKTLATLPLGVIPMRRLLSAGESIIALANAASDLIVVDDSLTEIKWRQSAAKTWSSFRPHLWRGLVLAGESEGMLWALDPESGAPHWQHQFDGTIRGIGSADGTIFVGTVEGMVYALVPKLE